jgi:ribosomal protein L7Ae-like RNA K-turn-binding protein
VSHETYEGRVQKVLQLLGLARRAGYAVVGTQAVKDALRRDELEVVLLATDASENALRRVQGTIEAATVSVSRCATRAELGRAVGRPEAVIVGVRDRGLGSRISKESEAIGE